MTIRLAQAVCFLSVAILGSSYACADRIDRFYGYWAPVGETWCDLSREQWMTEGSQIIISQNDIWFGNAGDCKEVGLWMNNNRLRASASCSNELGPINIIAEFWIDKSGTLHGKDGRGNNWKHRKCAAEKLDAADAKAKKLIRPSVNDHAVAHESQTFVAHAGSYRELAQARAEIARLLKVIRSDTRKFNAHAHRVDLGPKGVWYRVQIGPPGSQVDAERKCATIRDAARASCRVISAF